MWRGGAGLLAAKVAAAEAAPPRQVIVILGESVRADMLNCYRQTGLRTPNLDRLAREGMRYEKAYVCQPVCAPSRSAIWTGLYPHTNGVWGNSMPLGDTVQNDRAAAARPLHRHRPHRQVAPRWF